MSSGRTALPTITYGYNIGVKAVTFLSEGNNVGEFVVTDQTDGESDDYTAIVAGVAVVSVEQLEKVKRATGARLVQAVAGDHQLGVQIYVPKSNALQTAAVGSQKTTYRWALTRWMPSASTVLAAVPVLACVLLALLLWANWVVLGNELQKTLEPLTVWLH